MRKSAYKNRRLRRRRKMQKKALIFVIIITIIVLICYSLTLFFKIKTVNITGDVPYDIAEIEKSINLDEKSSLIFFNKLKIKKNLTKKFPYIENANITRVYPDTLNIELQKVKTFATIYQDETYYLIDVDGKIIEEVTVEKAKNYKRIFGIELVEPKVSQMMVATEPAKISSYQTLVEFLEAYDKLDNATELYFYKLYDIRVKYSNIYEVYFGTTEDLDHKMKFFNEVLNKLTPSDKGAIELANKTVARFRPATIPITEFLDDKKTKEEKGQAVAE